MTKTLVQLCSSQAESNFENSLVSASSSVKSGSGLNQTDQGGGIATSDLRGSQARSQRLLALWLGFIRTLRRYKQDKITLNREKAGMPRETN